ncbi:family 10 glycosylhydrolase [Prevotella sp. KH2C16]|uniref:glycoside hydrolase family 10 protein n=1 Tax=Prevotella sp. KH2C16 TaxID=1855325 RepID=UPI000B889620
MKKHMLTFIVLMLIMSAGATAGNKKREFRGAWMQFVNGMYLGMSTSQIQQMLLGQLDALQKDGANAVIFQVRGECDALYQSSIEPWSRYLTGVQGQPPSPYWDPLQWMIEQCHQRGMELHAWINPYRARMKTPTALAPNHILSTHPERAFEYGGLYVLNPGLKENREYILSVVDDIVKRYDIDGMHIDDYFYPYPEAGRPIPDDREFQLYNNGISNRGDWRRYNVDTFVKEMGEHIHALKPWVKFGVSPFGIYRNKKSDPLNGSETSGLQNYDDLYADILKWVNNGWIDYCVPQIYWEIGNRAADYQTLIYWWNRYAGGRPLYIGEDVERTAKNTDPQNPLSHQLPAKHALHEACKNVKGSVLWYAKSVTQNPGNYETLLRTDYWRYPALQPLMPFLDDKAPKKPRKVKPVWTSDGYVLFWTAPKAKKWGDEVRKYVVYRFAKGEKIDIDNPSKILKITADTHLILPYDKGNERYTYVVTSLDRVGNESKAAKKKVKL